MDRHGLEVLIPILVPLGAFAMAFGIRYLKNQERMAMIAKGIMPTDDYERKTFNPSRSLRMAAVLIGAGFGLLGAIWIDHTFYPYDAGNDDRAEGYYFALIALGSGIGLLSAYMYERKNPPSNPNNSRDEERFVG